MIKFFLKHFIRNYEDIDNPSVRKEYGKLAGIVGVVSNLILCCGKIIVESMAGSLSINLKKKQKFCFDFKFCT